MNDLLSAAVLPPNLVATGLLVVVLLYWLTVIVGLLDFKTVDFHADAHPGVHLDGAHLGAGHSDWLDGALAFFNIGRVPVMLFVSFVALSLWVGSILVNYYTGNTALLPGLVLLLPLLVGSLFVAKVLTMPFVKLFAALEQDATGAASALGKVCTVLLPTTPERLGQASVRIDGAPLMLNVRALRGSLSKGETALVIDYDEQRRCYLIEPYSST
jgi:hypothetical protein